MSKRKYTRVKTVEGLIVTMRAEGLTLREIGDELGLSYKQMRDWSYRHKPKTFQKADDLIDKYIHFYNYERIQTKTGMAPLTLRHSA